MADLTLRTESHAARAVYPRLGVRPLVMIGLFSVLVLVFMLSLMLGSVHIPLDKIIMILLGDEVEKVSWTTIILKFRLPKAITAALAGAALGVSGLEMQTLFRNPLADPFALGISSGASLGVAIVVLGMGFTGGALLVTGFGLLGNLSIAIAAGLGAALVMGMVLLASYKVDNTMTLLILGLMFGYTTSAVVSVLLYFSLAEQIQAYIAWTFGSFGGVTWGQMKIFAPAVLTGLSMGYRLAKPLNALLLGETYASSMGLTVNRARFWIIISTAILTGTVTAFCGPIAFLGVAVPHLCRSLFSTSDHRILMPAVIMMGALLALIADLVAQVPGSQITLPLNAVSALIGAPVVAWVILRRRNLRSAFAA